MGNALVDVLAQISSDDVLQQFGFEKGAMYLIDTPRFLELYDLMREWPLKYATGGSAGNTILALSNLGEPTGFIGRVGDDENAEFYKENSLRHGIDFMNVGSSGTSGVALTFISPDGQRTFGTHLGVAARLRAEHLEKRMFAGYDFFHVEGYLTQDHTLIEHAFNMASEAGLTTSIDLASYNIVAADRRFFNHLLSKVDIVFANEEEAEAFTGLQPEKALEVLAKKCPIAVVKVGHRGTLVARGEERVVVKARSVQLVDTTGAGDYYAAGFIYGLTHDYSLRACAEIGTLLASEVIQVVGTTLPETTWEGIRQEISTLSQL